MISIRKSLTDLERLDERNRDDLSTALLDCYAMAISSSAHYAVEVDPGLSVEFRTHLKVLEDQTRAAASGDQLRDVQSSFRGELREYRDKAAGHLKKMRQEIENATSAMLIFADSVAFNGENHENEVAAQLHGLQSTALSNSLEEVRGSIGNAVSGIESSIHQMQRSNQLVVAQLQDEIRALHQQMEEERKALYTDRASGAWNRQKIDLHIENLLRQNRPFCLLLVWVRNFKRLESQHTPTVLQGTLKAVISRLTAIIEGDGAIGRWSNDQFAAVLDMPAARAIALSSEVAAKLSGPYSVQENGLAQKITVQATAGVIERPIGADSSTFHQKLQQLSGAISGA